MIADTILRVIILGLATGVGLTAYKALSAVTAAGAHLPY